MVYLLQDASGTYVEGGWVDLVWLAGVAVIAAAPYVTRHAVPDPRPGDATAVFPLTVIATVASVAVIGLQQLHLVPWTAVVPADLALLLGVVRSVLRLRELNRVKAHEVEELQRLACTDTLTMLPNRLGLAAYVAQRDEQPHPRPLTVLVVDIDQLPTLTSSLGHAASDQLVLAVADRLATVTPTGAQLGRIQTGQFAVVLPTPSSDAHGLTQRILEAALEPIPLGEVQLHVGLRVGLAGAAFEAGSRCAVDHFDELLRLAELSVGRARRGNAKIFAQDRDLDTGGDRIRLTEDLRRALDGRDVEGSGHLLVHLQPQVQLTRPGLAPGAPSTLTTVGVEALVRWQHPEHGLLLPGAFLPLAADAGLMTSMTDVVLDAALAACRTWWADAPAPTGRARDDRPQVPVSVNVAAGDLLDQGWPDRVVAALERHGLPARALVLELTEETLLTDPDAASTTLTALKTLGVGVSIDDYGTGYSSLAYLCDLPADELKLDRAFARQLTAPGPRSARARAIVRSTTELAHSLDLRVVVEGVEDETTLTIVAELGADVAQGFGLAKPMPLAHMTTWFASSALGPRSLAAASTS